jgi:ElaB/YqjD/DUF883 family membrane-anchored ribosome-binding protein
VDEETSKIKHHIDSEREQLGRNLDEIEDRVRTATDLRAQFNKNTGWILGAAVAGGFLLSLTLGKSSNAVNGGNVSDYGDVSGGSQAQPAHRISPHLQRVSETVDDILAGLVALASEKLQSFVADAVPGFREQYDAISRHGSGSSVRAVNRDFAERSGARI